MKSLAFLAGALALATVSPVPATAAPGPGYRMQALLVPVRDFQKTTEFYAVLGMKAGAIYNATERELTWDGQAQGSSIIMIKADAEHPAGGHYSFLMLVPDVKATIARLTAAGYPMVREKTSGPVYEAIFTDPDGNRVTILTPPKM